MYGRGFQPRPRPLPKALGRGDSKRDSGTWTAIELLGLIFAKSAIVRILWERQSVFFP